MKNPLTPAGIEPAAFQFVAQHLNHCATVVPLLYIYLSSTLYAYKQNCDLHLVQNIALL